SAAGKATRSTTRIPTSTATGGSTVTTSPTSRATLAPAGTDRRGASRLARTDRRPKNHAHSRYRSTAGRARRGDELRRRRWIVGRWNGRQRPEQRRGRLRRG